MPKDVMYGKTLRKSFARTQEIVDMPNLLEIQKSSYKWFLETGLREVFKDVDSVTDYSGNLELSFIDYSMNEKPKYSEEECKARDATYAAPLKVRVRLRNKETEEIKEQEIFMGDFPLMTEGGTFIINGAERVIVSQIVRSPGVYFDRTVDKAMIATYGSTVIPYHGAWLEYETDANDVFYVRIDKNRKLPITWFLKAMGQYKAELDENGSLKPESCATWLSCVAEPTVGAVTNERIREIFGEDERILATLDKDACQSRDECLLEIYRKLRPGDPPTVESAETLLEGLFFDRSPDRRAARRAGRDPQPRQGQRDRRRRRGGRAAQGRRQERARVLQRHGRSAALRRLRPEGGRHQGESARDRAPAAHGAVPGRRPQGRYPRLCRHPRAQAHRGRRHVLLRQLPQLPGARHRRGRRHRPPRQPPRPLRGRTAAEPVPHRLLPHGARDPRAHDPAGSRHRHPAEPPPRALSTSAP